jgi:hypothetical protein
MTGAFIEILGVFRPDKTGLVDQKQSPNSHRLIGVFYQVAA